MTRRIFERADWICGGLAAAVAMVVYAWTAAPSVTLLDSGEFIVAAQHFGVPHPTGYPLWTLLAWLFQLLPLGNAAWEIALFSGVCGALAVGLATMLTRNTCVWMADGSPTPRPLLASIASVAFGLVFAFSLSMWSQAVIAEVYTLHALLAGIYLACLYWWLRRPERAAPIYWSFFALTLAFSNHQLTLALAPLPLLIVLLVRRDLFWDLVAAAALCVLVAYLGFALVADNPIVIKAAIRLAWLVGTGFVVLLWIKRGRLDWRLVAFLPLTIILGLLPYAYMPLAASTNPPMNWGYTSTADGFFYSFNRSQYHGSLSDQSLRVLRKAVGISEETVSAAARDYAASFHDQQAPADPADAGLVKRFQQWAQFFWFQLAGSFSPLCLVFFFATVPGVMRRPLAARVWIYLLNCGFLLAAFLQPLLDRAHTDSISWWTQMPYHTYTNLMFAILCGIGAVVVLGAIFDRVPRLTPAAWLLLALPAWPLALNAGAASQRDRWFGWKFGHDILKNLPRGSIVFGGTDPGRFVPTYMIFGESGQPARLKRDPAFDRRDLYIITQNGLADRYYLQYIRDHYTSARPHVRNSFEHWLGRDRAYPAEPIILPTPPQARKLAADAIEALEKVNPSAEPTEVAAAGQSAVAKWIFEKNKAGHAFYVEESFPMEWTYDHAIPDGLVYRLHPEPLDALPPAAVTADFAFWKNYIAELEVDPNFAKDFDAQRTFSKLRMTTANLYAHRKMKPEAERALREALRLWPGNVVALNDLSRLLWDRGEFDEPIQLLRAACLRDLHSLNLLGQLTVAERRKEMQGEIAAAERAVREQPQSIDAFKRLLTVYAQAGETNKWTDAIAAGKARFASTPAFLDLMIQVAEARREWADAAKYAGLLAKEQPTNTAAYYRLGRAEYKLGRKDAAIQSLRKALALGGFTTREMLMADPAFSDRAADLEISKLLRETPEAVAGERGLPAR